MKQLTVIKDINHSGILAPVSPLITTFSSLSGERVHANQDPGRLLLLRVRPARVAAPSCQELCEDGPGYVWGHQVKHQISLLLLSYTRTHSEGISLSNRLSFRLVWRRTTWMDFIQGLAARIKPKNRRILPLIPLLFTHTSPCVSQYICVPALAFNHRWIKRCHLVLCAPVSNFIVF